MSFADVESPIGRRAEPPRAPRDPPRPRARRLLMRRALMAVDAAGLLLAFLIAESAFGVGNDPNWWAANHVPLRIEIALFVLTVPGWLLVANLYGLYSQDEERMAHSTADDIVDVFHMVTVGVWLLLAGAWLTQLAQPKLPKVVTFWALAIALVTVGRALARRWGRSKSWYVQRVVVAGAGEVGQMIAWKILRHPEYGLDVVGFADPSPPKLRPEVSAVRYLGDLDHLPQLVHELGVDRVLVAPTESYEDEIELVQRLRPLRVQVDVVPRLYEVLGPGMGFHAVEGVPLIGLPPRPISRSAARLKRTFDLLGAAACLLLTAPLFAFIAWRVRRDSPGPIFFRQTRLGMDMREITVVKFRSMKTGTNPDPHREYIRSTMTSAPEKLGNGLYKLEREEAVTPFGRWLRRTSLDELPQLLNVLRGEMSLVGPRPCLPYEVEHFKPHHFERFLVPPGLTGLWQVTARARSTFLEALEMDVAYVRGWSLGLDFRLLLRTPFQLLTRAPTV